MTVGIIEQRDARIAVLEAENAGLREALRPFAKIRMSVGDSLWVDVGDAGVHHDGTNVTAADVRRAAAAYPTHSEGGEAASPSPSALTEDRKLDHPSIWLEPVCIGRCWSQDGAHTECDCGGEHKPTKYIRADIASDLSPKGGTRE